MVEALKLLEKPFKFTETMRELRLQYQKCFDLLNRLFHAKPQLIERYGKGFYRTTYEGKVWRQRAVNLLAIINPVTKIPDKP